MKKITYILLIREYEFLSISLSDNETKFSLPGGKLKDNSDFITTGIIELYEETGLTVQKDDLVLLYTHYNNEFYIKIYLSFCHTGKIIINKDYKVKWLSIEYLYNFNKDIYYKYMDYLTI